jgi:hypothetical protein
VLRPKVKRTRSGQYELRLTEEEREVLRRLPGELRELLGTDDPSLARLFPPAYVGEADREAEYRRLMGDDLLARHVDDLNVMEATVDAERLDEEQMTAWLRALNELRLVLGTRLDVSEDMYDEELDPADPRAPAFSLYVWLGWFQEHVIQALG